MQIPDFARPKTSPVRSPDFPACLLPGPHQGNGFGSGVTPPSAVHMENPQSVLLSIRRSNWMITVELKDAYLQLIVLPEPRRYLRFVIAGKVYHVRMLCFGLATAPQVFTRVMAPVSATL